ncbi:AMP-binding protein [Pseudomonas floridensis]|uniref:AMP-binding protein n=1 Tax=Pseudomonas floridensis TaxID=1958950 RepID=A0A1X0N5X1_9PSED|nr:AMP-binding protein [Pseudomonas floridensis]ORC58945.1 AMP-binding protein [Pseudomonas floridensis]
MLSYSAGLQHPPLLDQTLGAALTEAVARWPEQDALIVPFQQLRYSWRELGHEVDTLARALLALGIDKGQRIGLWAPNCAQWCITQLASAKIGAVLVNINPAYRTSELTYALQRSGCSWLVTADRFKDSDYHAMLGQIVPHLLTHDANGWSCDELPMLRGVISLAEDPPSGMLPWRTLYPLAESVSQSDLDQRAASLDANDPINIQYTSGTTGFPKGATLSHRNILNNGYMVGHNLGLGPSDRLVIPVPLYHCFGMVMGNLACLTLGATMIYPAPSFEPLATLQAVASEHATFLYGVPTMFIKELDLPERQTLDLSSLKGGIMAGSICPIEVMRQVIDQMHMKGVQIAYGMTETSPVSLQTANDDPLELRVTSVGRTQPHLEHKVIDTDGNTLERGEVGELCTRGYSVMLGYWQDPDATARDIDADGWMHTADLVRMDADGYVTIVGRSKDMIIRGGENIYPREIEELLLQHAGIAEAYVVGVPCQRYGEELVAWVRLHPGHRCDDLALRDFFRPRVAHFKVPRHFFFVDEFPMTVTGKVQKFRMREISVQRLNAGGESG